MRVTIKLFATFRDQRFKVDVRELPEGSRVEDILRSLDITPEEVAICLLNGQDVNVHDANVHNALRDGDTLALFPPVGGG